MSDILKLMKLDFISAMGVTGALFTIGLTGVIILSLLVSPIMTFYLVMITVALLVSPLQGISDKSNSGKLYGILPIDRQNITRARFLYIFLVGFVTEIFSLALAGISCQLKLVRFLPAPNTELMQLLRENFDELSSILSVCVGIFAFTCIVFAYMEMMVQIFGSENEMKIIAMTIGVFMLLAFAFVLLNDRDLVPVISLEFPKSTAKRILLGISLNVGTFLICAVFEKITRSKVSKREL